MLAEWERLFAIRDDVLRALEEARVAKQIGSSLEAKVTLEASGSALELLQRHQSDLRYVFIVSQVELKEGGENVSITVSRADGEKCERCWNYSTRVGESETYPTVCERCVAALKEIEQEAVGPSIRTGPMTNFMDTNNKDSDLRTRFAWRAGYLLAAFGIYLADQASKAWAVKALRFGEDRVLIRGFLQFIYTENPGIAFGQLQEGGSFGRWFFVVLASLRGGRGLLLFHAHAT